MQVAILGTSNGSNNLVKKKYIKRVKKTKKAKTEAELIY